jgi:hypothetical protein
MIEAKQQLAGDFLSSGADIVLTEMKSGTDLPLSKAAPSAAKSLDHGDVAALFGLEMTETASSDAPTSPERPGRTKATKVGKSRAESKTRAANETKTKAAQQNSSPRTSRTNSEPKWVALVRARKRRRRRDHAA